MDHIYKRFFTDVYSHTGGYFSVLPNSFNVHPGDFFQIMNGEIVFLGNIFNPRIIEPFETDFEYDIELNPSQWSFESQVSRPYSGRGTGVNITEREFEFNRQVLSFKDRGSYLFKGENPRLIRIKNWNDIQDELILKLTQTYYSFRSLYLVTECVTLDRWALAIAGAESAELELSNAESHSALTELFAHEKSQVVQSRDMELVAKEEQKKSNFFKVKRLAVKNDQLDVFISDLLQKGNLRTDWANSFFPHDFHKDRAVGRHLAAIQMETSLLDFLQGNQLNPNTVLNYFKWENGRLDDVNKLFITHD